MRRYLISLLVITLALVLAAFVVMWTMPQYYLPVMPWLALYFGVTCGVQHWLVTHAMQRSPRAFVQIFLATVVGVLLLHIIVLAAYLFTHPSHARLFSVAFCIGYIISLAFETLALVKFVSDERRRRQTTDN